MKILISNFFNTPISIFTLLTLLFFLIKEKWLSITNLLALKIRTMNNLVITNIENNSNIVLPLYLHKIFLQKILSHLDIYLKTLAYLFHLFNISSKFSYSIVFVSSPDTDSDVDSDPDLDEDIKEELEKLYKDPEPNRESIRQLEDLLNGVIARRSVKPPVPLFDPETNDWVKKDISETNEVKPDTVLDEESTTQDTNQNAVEPVNRDVETPVDSEAETPVDSEAGMSMDWEPSGNIEIPASREDLTDKEVPSSEENKTPASEENKTASSEDNNTPANEENKETSAKEDKETPTEYVQGLSETQMPTYIDSDDLFFTANSNFWEEYCKTCVLLGESKLIEKGLEKIKNLVLLGLRFIVTCYSSLLNFMYLGIKIVIHPIVIVLQEYTLTLFVVIRRAINFIIGVFVEAIAPAVSLMSLTSLLVLVYISKVCQLTIGCLNDSLCKNLVENHDIYTFLLGLFIILLLFTCFLLCITTLDTIKKKLWDFLYYAKYFYKKPRIVIVFFIRFIFNMAVVLFFIYILGSINLSFINDYVLYVYNTSFLVTLNTLRYSSGDWFVYMNSGEPSKGPIGLGNTGNTGGPGGPGGSDGSGALGELDDTSDNNQDNYDKNISIIRKLEYDISPAYFEYLCKLINKYDTLVIEDAEGLEFICKKTYYTDLKYKKIGLNRSTHIPYNTDMLHSRPIRLYYKQGTTYVSRFLIGPNPKHIFNKTFITVRDGDITSLPAECKKIDLNRYDPSGPKFGTGFIVWQTTDNRFINTGIHAKINILELDKITTGKRNSYISKSINDYNPTNIIDPRPHKVIASNANVSDKVITKLNTDYVANNNNYFINNTQRNYDVSNIRTNHAIAFGSPASNVLNSEAFINSDNDAPQYSRGSSVLNSETFHKYARSTVAEKVSLWKHKHPIDHRNYFNTEYPVNHCYPITDHITRVVEQPNSGIIPDGEQSSGIILFVEQPESGVVPNVEQSNSTTDKGKGRA